MDIILIPGLWLDASSWERVTPVLQQAGHRTHPLTLPGMASRHTDRSGITLRDHVDAIVAAIDSAAQTGGEVAVVGHSAGCGIAYAAVDARPEKVSCVVYIGGFPTSDGDTIADGFPVVGSDVPLPDWSDFGEEDLADLDEAARAEFRERAIPSPVGVIRERQRLSDERRYTVPAAVIATEFTSQMLREWIDQGMAPVQEFRKLHYVEYTDLPTGHWPQFTRPQDLARLILRLLEQYPEHPS